MPIIHTTSVGTFPLIKHTTKRPYLGMPLHTHHPLTTSTQPLHTSYAEAIDKYNFFFNILYHKKSFEYLSKAADKQLKMCFYILPHVSENARIEKYTKAFNKHFIYFFYITRAPTQ